MSTLKNNWLRASLSLIVLLFGVFIVVRAMEKMDERTMVKATVDEEWFEFTGGPLDSPTDQTKYRLLEDGDPTPNCSPGDQVCMIKAPVGLLDDEPVPVIDIDLEDEIENATTNQTHSPTVRVRQ